MAKKKSAAKRKAQQQQQQARQAQGANGMRQASNGFSSDGAESDDGNESHTTASVPPTPSPFLQQSTSSNPEQSASVGFNFSMDLDDLTPSQKAERCKADGNDKFKSGQYGAAIDFYSEAIQLDPEEPSYYTNRAAAYMALKRYNLALQDCQKAAAIQAGAPQPKTLSRLARCQIALGQIDDASRTIAEVLQLEANNASALADRARIEKIRADITNVEREKSKKEWTYVLYGLDSLEKEVDSFPLPWRVTKVEALLGKRRLEDASSLASDLLRSHPSEPDVLWVRGLVLFAQGNTAQAVAHAQAALRNDPDHSQARILLKKTRQIESTKEAGNEQFKSGQWQNAIGKYTECLDLLDGEHESIRITLLSNRATAYQKAGNHEAAIADADEILSKDAKHFKALRTRARAHFAAEHYEAAVADFASAYNEAPSGSAEERAMKTEHRQAEVALKRSKTKDYYKILQVERTATEVEIKKAYRKQSLLHHPDKGGDEEKFKEMQEAHSVLSDPMKRRRYDMGEDDSDMMGGGPGFHSHPFASGGFGGFGGGSPFGGGGFGGGFDDGGINLEDLLGGGGRRAPRYTYSYQ